MMPDVIDPKPSRIVVTFAGPGMADSQLTLENVTPGQVQAAAWFVDQYARELRAQQTAGNLPGQIVRAGVVPFPGPQRVRGS